MHHSIRRTTWLLLICGSIATLAASPPVIGVARSRGAFLINNASVPGTATLLDGTSVRTMELSSDVKLRTGERLTLGSQSVATIYQDRLVLESGTAEVDRLYGYRVEAGALRIGASISGSSVRVAVNGNKQVQVAAMTGAAEVRNAKGALVAQVLPGMALELQTAEGNASDLTGVVTSEHGKFYLTDEITNVRVELRGANLKQLLGKKAHVKGTTVPASVAGDDAVFTVASATLVGVSAAAGGAAAAGAATTAGISSTAIGLIVVGGVAVGTVGGLAAAGTFSSSNPTISR
jgi:hypothetical protein